MSIVREGYPFIIAPALIGAAFLVFLPGWPLKAAGFILMAAALFCAFFFRDPFRSIPADGRLVVSPCDGKVMEVNEENGMRVIRVFLSVFNVHLQRSPVAGTVTSVEYRPGRFLPAMDPRAHLVNEQNVFTIKTVHGDFIVKQIAGILARRVVAWSRPGDTLERGSKIGLIKFGSQVDIHTPLSVKVTVVPGDIVKGGESVIGEIQ